MAREGSSRQIAKKKEAGVTGRVISVINMQAPKRRQLLLKISPARRAVVDLSC